MINLALIKNSVVKNIILLADESGLDDAKRFYNQYDDYVIVEQFSPISIGWGYVNKSFVEPEYKSNAASTEAASTTPTA